MSQFRSWQISLATLLFRRCSVPAPCLLLRPEPLQVAKNGRLMVTSQAKIQRGPVMAERNFANHALYHGDNLDFLREMKSSTVNLIATGPPLNKSRDFHATPDSLSSGAQFQARWSWHDDIHGVVTPSGPATTGRWGCSRRMRKRSIGRSHRTRCRQHPLIRGADWSTRRKGDTGLRDGGTFPAGAIRRRGSCS